MSGREPMAPALADDGPAGESMIARPSSASLFGMMINAVIATAVLAIAMPARADTPLPPAALANTALADPAQEQQAKALMTTLRCLVCQGQSIADSDADLAGDMRALVRERIRAGERPEAVRRWLIQRYGDYVSYDPPWNWATMPLWLAPLALLAAGGWLTLGSFRRRVR